MASGPDLVVMWATTSTSSYVGTCIFLIALGVVLLLLIASKSVLERWDVNRRADRRHVIFIDQNQTERISESEALLTPNGLEKDVMVIEQDSRSARSWKVIALRATIVTLITAILYIQ